MTSESTIPNPLISLVNHMAISSKWEVEVLCNFVDPFTWSLYTDLLPENNKSVKYT